MVDFKQESPEVFYKEYLCNQAQEYIFSYDELQELFVININENIWNFQNINDYWKQKNKYFCLAMIANTEKKISKNRQEESYQSPKNKLVIISFIVALKIIDEVELLFMATSYKQRNKSYGSKVMREFKSFLRQKEVINIYLEVNSQNLSAISFYIKHGFKNYGLRKNYYPDGNDAILMKCTNFI